ALPHARLDAISTTRIADVVGAAHRRAVVVGHARLARLTPVGRGAAATAIYVGLCLVLDVVCARRRLAALGAAGAHCARAIRGVVAQLTCAASGAAATAVRVGFVPVLDVVVTRGLCAAAPAADAVGTIGGQRAALAGFTLGA